MNEFPTLTQKIGAEALGTFVLVFFGCGSIVFSAQEGGLTTITTVGLAFGLSVVVMVYAVGRISGGHFNPAVSVGAGMAGRIAWRDAGVYIAAQVAGAILAGLALFTLLQGFDGFDATGNMGQNFFGDQNPSEPYAAWAAFLLETLLTALFLFVILAVTDSRNQHPALAPLAIGLTLAAIHFVAIPATGTSVNPARSIGPALFAGGDAIVQLWLFILAPRSAGRSPVSSTRWSSARTPSGSRDPGSASAVRRRPRCRATEPPTSTSSSGTSRIPRCRPRCRPQDQQTAEGGAHVRPPEDR